MSAVEAPPPLGERGHEAHREIEHAAAPETTDLVRIGLVALAVVVSWLDPWRPFAGTHAIALIATLAGGYPIFREAMEALLRRRMTMELSMTIALVAALVIGESFTALVIVLFVLIAEVLEHLTVGRGRGAIKDLLDFLPREVTIRRGDTTEDVRAADVGVGDVVIVKPGSRIPVDGAVIAGHSFVDQATITGESMPAEKMPGASVYAGTINQSGVLEVRTRALGRDTAFGKIVEAVERAEETRAPIQKLADRLAGYLVYFALGAAAVTFLVTRDARSTISVVIVAGACGIAAGTPLAILGAIGQAARRGAVIKGGRYLELLAKVDTVVFDKTGTLTFGVPEVSRVIPTAGIRDEEVLEAAATAEARSEHPLGKAILATTASRGLRARPPETFQYTPGLGITCTLRGEEIVVGNAGLMRQRGIVVDGELPQDASGGSRVVVARAGRILGAIDVTDVVRREARAAVSAIRAMGLRTLLFTGDRKAIATAVGEEIGVDGVQAELLPGDKVDRVKALLAHGRTVAMVGDGINDSPALIEASVGIAMGSGTDVARESADVMLIGNDLMTLVDTLAVARRCRRIIMVNFVGTLAVDGLGVGLAAAGLLNPLLAAFIHVSSELAFILNSARLLGHVTVKRSKPIVDADSSRLGHSDPEFIGR
jgi:heavy metal translocating P-type ATPase